MLLRDRIRARMSEMVGQPDYQRLAADVLGIRNAPPDLARRLVAQALVVEERRDAWKLVGERICAEAPPSPGVYVLRDQSGDALYVGKAANLRRRLRAHFARRRWTSIKPDMARAVDAEWQAVGSELEALLREAALIHELKPVVNVQVGEPVLQTRSLPAALIRDIIVIVPSMEQDSVELVAARTDGRWLIQRTRRNGADLTVHSARLMRFFHSPLWRSRGYRLRAESTVDAAPIVFSWLAGRGAAATRIDPDDAATRRDLGARLAAVLADEGLFSERIEQRYRSRDARRPLRKKGSASHSV